MLVPRYYQNDGIQSVFDYFDSGNRGNPIIAMPTGTGKSVVIGGFVHRVLNQWPRQRIVNATHVKELVQQNYNKLNDIWPGVPAGICSAGLKRWETHNPITFGGIDTMINRLPELGHVDLLLIDECQLVSEKDDATYLRFINELRRVNKYLKVIGFTATPYRQGLGYLTNGKIFTDICYDITTLEWFNKLIDEGYLCKLIVPKQSVEMSLDGIPSVGGEFKQSEIENRAMQITDEALDRCMRYANERRKWLTFASGVEHAVYIHENLSRRGIKSAVVHSKMKSPNERDDILQAYAEGYLQNLSNYGILTTGFDAPDVDMIVMLRATKSVVLWVQMLGRGTRPHPSKVNTLVLDFGQNAARLGPINDPVIPKQKGKQAGEAPIKICDNCGCMMHISARFCDGCGAEFIFETPYKREYSSVEVLATERKEPEAAIERFEVQRVYYTRHQSKHSGLSTFKVSYVTKDNRFINEFISIEAEGRARKKAADWWSLRTQMPCPATIAEALEQVANLSVPSAIRVNTSGDFPKVIAYEYV